MDDRTLGMMMGVAFMFVLILGVKNLRPTQSEPAAVVGEVPYKLEPDPKLTLQDIIMRETNVVQVLNSLQRQMQYDQFDERFKLNG